MAEQLKRPKGVALRTAPAGRRFRWRRLLWALVFPRMEQRVAMTVSGFVLIGLSIGVGVAAYNTASNILFIALSLMLGCLILSGVLSWLNFRGLHWSLEVDAPMRAGREHPVGLSVRNAKKFLPSYGLSFDVASTSRSKPQQIALRERVDPAGEAKVGWTVTPARRGIENVELKFVGSLFPFGFLHKRLVAHTVCEVLVWPAPVQYRRFSVPAWKRVLSGQPVPRAGHNGDLLALRRYQAGDSHRQIHWKASARARKLVVRQFAADSQEAFILHVPTSGGLWKSAEQFELLCSLAATLAEDLFKQERLDAVAVDDEAPLPVRGVRDLEAFLDRLATLQPDVETAGGKKRTDVRTRRRNILTFAPEGARGVEAHVDGEKAAAA